MHVVDCGLHYAASPLSIKVCVPSAHITVPLLRHSSSQQQQQQQRYTATPDSSAVHATLQLLYEATRQPAVITASTYTSEASRWSTRSSHASALLNSSSSSSGSSSGSGSGSSSHTTAASAAVAVPAVASLELVFTGVTAVLCPAQEDAPLVHVSISGCDVSMAFPNEHTSTATTTAAAGTVLHRHFLTAGKSPSSIVRMLYRNEAATLMHCI
jgi:hypothetical protein